MTIYVLLVEERVNKYEYRLYTLTGIIYLSILLYKGATTFGTNIIVKPCHKSGCRYYPQRKKASIAWQEITIIADQKKEKK